MPVWETVAPPDDRNSGYRLLRTPATRALVGHILSEELLGCRTHYVHSRTTPCDGPKCETCAAGIGYRWHAYIALVIDATQEIIIFETTRRSSTAITEYFQRYKTTRGALLKAQRVGGKPNGRVLLQLRQCDLAKIALPRAPNIKKCMAHIWNLPPNQIETTDHAPVPPFKELRPDPTKPALPNLGDKPTEHDRQFVHRMKRPIGGNGNK